MAKEARQYLNDELKSLLASGEYSDFTIVCYNDTYAVHKNVICPRSDYFSKVVKFGKEANEGKVTLKDDEPRIVKLMLQYFYEADYNPLASTDNSTKGSSNALEEQKPQVSGPSTAAVAPHAVGSLQNGFPEAVHPEDPEPVAELVPEPIPEPPPEPPPEPEPEPMAAPINFDPWGFSTKSMKKKKGKKGVEEVKWFKSKKKHAVHKYELPHTCGSSCSPSLPYKSVCEHHICGASCDFDCKSFICTICAPEYFGKQLLTHTQVYQIADKYDVRGLKDLVKEKFALACKYGWNEEWFPIAVSHAFESTPDQDSGLRDVIIATISEHMSLLKKPEIEAQMKEFNGLAYGLLKVKVMGHSWI